MSSPQINAAALVAAKVISEYGAENVSFTGHSLGGGLASLIAVWFDRPATVFDAAPFENTAIGPGSVDAARIYIAAEAGLTNSALNAFSASENFFQREQAISSYFLQGEVLEWLRGIFPAVAGSDTPVEFGTGMMEIDSSLDSLRGDRITLHSQVLLTAGLMSDSFRQATVTVQAVLPVVMDGDLYDYNPASSTEPNFLIDLIRSEQANIGNGKLSHFAADLHRLGQNLTGLNEAAQKAIVAQGVEWYYWQGSNYAGQEFFVRNGALLQYTSALGASLPSAQNKAEVYVQPWLEEVALSHGVSYSVDWAGKQQWSVATGATDAVVGSARNLDLTQLGVGNAGADRFTGGRRADVFFGGAGNDTLVGAAGNDSLFGGAGVDRYVFNGAFGQDVVLDVDGMGQVFADGVRLSGGQRYAGASQVWISADGAWRYLLMSDGHLLINKVGSSESVTVRDWQSAGGNGLGIVLAEGSTAQPTPVRTYLGDQRAKLIGIEIDLSVTAASSSYNTYKWSSTSWGTDGTLNDGLAEAGFADVIYGSGRREGDVLSSLTGAF